MVRDVAGSWMRRRPSWFPDDAIPTWVNDLNGACTPREVDSIGDGGCPVAKALYEAKSAALVGFIVRPGGRA